MTVYIVARTPDDRLPDRAEDQGLHPLLLHPHGPGRGAGPPPGPGAGEGGAGEKGEGAGGAGGEGSGGGEGGDNPCSHQRICRTN